MGFLKDETGFMMIGQIPKGTCEMYAVKHDADQPHNKDSMTYQYKFYDQNGRWPTWKDAMDHCSEDVQKLWTDTLIKKGVSIDDREK